MAQYDKCDPDRRVLKLTRAGHHLWSLRRANRDMSIEEQAIDAALETIWAAKRELKAEIVLEKAAKIHRLKERFARG